MLFIDVLKDILNKFYIQKRSNKNLDSSTYVNKKAPINVQFQKIFFHFRTYKKMIPILEKGLNFFMKDLSNNKLTNSEVGHLQTMLSLCTQILLGFVKENPENTNVMLKHVDLFLKYSQINIGQGDFLTCIYSNPRIASQSMKRKLIDHFKILVLNQGRQERFLSLILSFAQMESTSDIIKTQLYILDVLLPIDFNEDEFASSHDILYSFYNKEHHCREFYLKDSFINYRHEKHEQLIILKDEPFIYHTKILKIMIALLNSKINQTAKSRIKRYFKFNYLLKLLTLDRNSLEDKQVKNLEELDDQDKIYQKGLLMMRRSIAEFIYLVYIKDEIKLGFLKKEGANITSKFLEEFNEKVNRSSKDLERSIGKENQFYVRHVLEIFLGLFEKSEGIYHDKDDNFSKKQNPKDFSIREYRNNTDFFNMIKSLPVILTEFYNVFPEDLVIKFEDTISKFHIPVDFPWGKHTKQRQQIILDLNRKEGNQKRKIHSFKNLEEIEDPLRIKVKKMVDPSDIWKLSLYHFNLKKKEFLSEEISVLAKVILRLSQIFPDELIKTYGFDFTVSDMIKKFVGYLGSQSTSSTQKIQMINLLLSMLSNSENVTARQNMFDTLGVTFASLIILKEADLDEYFLIMKIISLLIAMLDGGNKNVQQSIFELFSKNANLAEGIFQRFDTILFFYKSNSEFHTAILSRKNSNMMSLSQKILKLIQLMCEQHYEPMQNLMREQSLARNSYNILESIGVVVKKLSESDTPIEKVYSPLIQALDTLIEMIQGPCLQNQTNIISGNLIIELNKIITWDISIPKIKSKRRETSSKNQISDLNRNSFEDKFLVIDKVNRSLKLENNLNKYSVKKISRYYSGKKTMSKQHRLLVIHKVITLFNSMLELQDSKGALKRKVQKDIDKQNLFNLLTMVYARFAVFNKRNYTTDIFNHVRILFMVLSNFILV